MKSESFWFTSRGDIGHVAEAFRQAIEAHNGIRQKMAGGVAFERPTGSDPFGDLQRGPDFHVVAVISNGRLETAVPVGVHLRLWQEEGGVVGEVEGRWFGVLMGPATRKWLGWAVEGMRNADTSLAETQPR